MPAIMAGADGRGQGVGKALLDETERCFPRARYIFFCVSSFNPRALLVAAALSVVGGLLWLGIAPEEKTA